MDVFQLTAAGNMIKIINYQVDKHAIVNIQYHTLGINGMAHLSLYIYQDIYIRTGLIHLTYLIRDCIIL